MNLYEVLEVSQGASSLEIKRAYFRLIRIYPPEKDAQAFMRLRAAYEELSDEDRRAAYDDVLASYPDMPSEVLNVILEAGRKAVRGMPEDAVKILEQSDHFAHHEIQYTLCRLYSRINKSGKAVKLIEKHIKKNPDDIAGLRVAADVYMCRGYTKKALEIAKKLKCLDPADEENTEVLLFEEMVFPPDVVGGLIERIEEGGGKAPLLCLSNLGRCIGLDPFAEDEDYEQLAFDFLQPIKEQPWTDPNFAAEKLNEHTKGISAAKQKKVGLAIKEDILGLMFHVDCYHILPAIDEVIKNVKADEIFAQPEYEIAAAGYQALSSVNAGIPKTLVILPLLYLWSQTSLFDEESREEYRKEILIYETEILESYVSYYPQIKRFKKMFPLFYQHAAVFFEMILNAGDHKIYNEMQRRVYKLMNLELDLQVDFDWLGEDDEPSDLVMAPEPKEQRRVTKVGRNDPCPCGSGKKYKKCCGT